MGLKAWYSKVYILCTKLGQGEQHNVLGAAARDHSEAKAKARAALIIAVEEVTMS
jgi:hypothetical protein